MFSTVPGDRVMLCRRPSARRPNSVMLSEAKHLGCGLMIMEQPPE